MGGLVVASITDPVLYRFCEYLLDTALNKSTADVRATKHFVPTKDKKEIISRYLAGESLRAIASSMVWGYGTVLNIWTAYKRVQVLKENISE